MHSSISNQKMLLLCDSVIYLTPTAAMHALGIPTTRALSLVSLPALPVVRERTESACVLARLAPSFIRIGSFEAFNAPQGMFFFGGGQQEPGWEGLRVLGEWVAGRVLGIWSGADEGAGDSEAWGKEFVMEVARRNARMVAAWQVYGFMHGVINTDKCVVFFSTSFAALTELVAHRQRVCARADHRLW